MTHCSSGGEFYSLSNERSMRSLVYSFQKIHHFFWEQEFLVLQVGEWMWVWDGCVLFRLAQPHTLTSHPPTIDSNSIGIMSRWFFWVFWIETTVNCHRTLYSNRLNTSITHCGFFWVDFLFYIQVSCAEKERYCNTARHSEWFFTEYLRLRILEARLQCSQSMNENIQNICVRLLVIPVYVFGMKGEFISY